MGIPLLASTNRFRPDVRLLVPGGAGFIGSAFVRATLGEHPEDTIVVLDKLTYAGNLENLRDVRSDPRFSFQQGDICDAALVAELTRGMDAVVNFAAETHVDRSILDAGDFVQTDVYGAWVLAEASRQAGVARLVHVSTDEVYGAVLEGASRETDALDPSSPYSASKAGGELLVQACHRTFGLPCVIVRGANAYGPYQYPEKLIPLHITNAIEDQPLPVYGDGQQRRQWTHVDDFVSGVDVALRQGAVGAIYNVGNPEAEEDLPVNIEVSRQVLRSLGKPESLIAYVADRPAHDRRYRVDAARLVELGWRPRWRFVDGLADTVRWYAENPWWWQPIKSGSYRAYYERNYGNRSELVKPEGAK